MRAISVLLLALLLLVPVPGVADPSPSTVSASSGPEAGARAQPPALRVRRMVTALDVPWDVQPVGGGRFLVTERDRARLWLVTRRGGKQRVRFPSRKVWRSGETGLASLEVDPGFARNRRFYTCSGWRTGRGPAAHDVRVNAWRLSPDGRRAKRLRTLVAGFPTSTGRHAGCRLLILGDGSLLVGTGDAARSRVPRDLRSLGGKTLRLDRMTGEPWPDNPWPRARNERKRYVFTYGHRNVQGLAERADGSLWSVEHGPHHDDEVNRLRPGGDYGWQPGPGYDESVPMTDHSLPGRQVRARWRSGRPTLATSGATFVHGERWGALDGTLAVAALKSSRLLFLRFDDRGRFQRSWAPPALRRHGRLRSVTRLGNGDLLVTTSNGSGRDAVLLVRPR